MGHRSARRDALVCCTRALRAGPGRWRRDRVGHRRSRRWHAVGQPPGLPGAVPSGAGTVASSTPHWRRRGLPASACQRTGGGRRWRGMGRGRARRAAGGSARGRGGGAGHRTGPSRAGGASAAAASVGLGRVGGRRARRRTAGVRPARASRPGNGAGSGARCNEPSSAWTGDPGADRRTAGDPGHRGPPCAGRGEPARSWRS